MKLFRISNVLSLAVATLFGILLFWTSQAVQKREDELTDLKKSLNQQQETTRVLQVEWDYLSRPQRLEKLAREQLGMELPSAKEVVSGLDQIPEPSPVKAASALMEEDGLSQSLSVDAEPPAPKLITKSVKSETVSPSSAEKKDFNSLIQNLDTKGGR